MAGFSGPNIASPKDIVFCIDAINKKCYSGAGTDVEDISFNKAGIGTMQNSLTWSSTSPGYFAPDGVDDQIYWSAPDMHMDDAAATGYSVEIWVAPSDNTNSVRTVLDRDSSTTNGYGIWFYRNDFWTSGLMGNFVPYQRSSDPTNYMNATYTTTLNTWIQRVMSCPYDDTRVSANQGGRGYRYFENGTQVSAWGGPTDATSLGGASASEPKATYIKGEGKIALIRVYKKRLSSSDVLQNFNAQRSRFGL